jgi:hypothetical protein
MRKTLITKAATLGAVLTVGSFAAFTPSAQALSRGLDLVNAPEYCVAMYGDPAPCPPPDRPEPIDQDCLRVDITPLHCPWLP